MKVPFKKTKIANNGLRLDRTPAGWVLSRVTYHLFDGPRAVAIEGPFDNEQVAEKMARAIIDEARRDDL